MMVSERGYFFGYSFGNMLKEGGNEDVDLEALIKGLKHSLANTPPEIDPAQSEAVVKLIRARQEQMQNRREEAQQQAEVQSLAAAKSYLESNKARDNIRVTDSGLQYEIIEDFDGASPTASSRVVVHYEGRLTSGKVFDSSRKRNEPAEFGLQQVIPGWTEGLQLMSVGDKYRFYIPPELAYGAGGVPGIPPNSVLIFDVELLEIK